ncbi:MAG: hypothetical protein KJ935_06255 [Candidatus Omnitrophica bacterium]|nr:hypothetical protein [Candidatus Omnitrophota bacterium]
MLFLVPAVIFLGGASLPTQTVMLNFASLPERLLSLADKIVSGELTDSPQKSLKGEPSYGSAPLYGAIVLGEGSGGRFIFSLDGNILYFDSDQDGDLRKEQPLVSQPAVKGLFRKTLLSFPPVLVQLSYPDDVSQEYRLAVTCDLEQKTFNFVNLGYRFGTVIFLPPEKNLKVAIYDANPPNGVFNDFGKDLLLVDLNRDGEFDISSGSPEKVLLAKTLSFAGDVYAIEVMNSGEYLDIRQPPVGKQPSGVVAITYVTKLDHKNKTQSGEGESVFRNGSFQVICSRGPAAFRRGGSSEAFIRNGELTLYDFYNRPWKARFVGSSLTPAAVLTSFPSQFSVGFPLEHNLTTDKKEYRPAENVVVSTRLVGQAKETYTYFAPGEKSRKTQPPGTDPNKLFFEESKPRLVIKDQAGNVITEGDLVLKPPDRYQFTWRIPTETVISDKGALYRAIVFWDTGPFQGVVTAEAQFSIVK